MDDRLNYLLDDFADSLARLNEVRDFIELNSKNSVVMSYLLTAIIDSAREQGRLLVDLNAFGIDSVADAVRAYTKRKADDEQFHSC